MTNPYDIENNKPVDSHHQVLNELDSAYPPTGETSDLDLDALEATEAQLGEEEILEPEPSEEVKALKQALANALDHLKRSEAERQNDRHRNEREMAKAHKFALEKFATDLLPVTDSLERGLTEIAANNGSLESLQQGTELTLNILLKVLNKYKVTQVDPLGETFNPEWHEAVSIVAVPDAKPNTIHQVLQKGYLLNDRLVRPAMVIVTK